jgi:hypothetical protein
MTTKDDALQARLDSILHVGDKAISQLKTENLERHFNLEGRIGSLETHIDHIRETQREHRKFLYALFGVFVGAMIKYATDITAQKTMTAELPNSAKSELKETK